MEWLSIAPIAGLVSLGAAGYCYLYVRRQDSGNQKMREIAGAIREGSTAYLKRQYKNLTAGTLAGCNPRGTGHGFDPRLLV